MLDAEVGKKEAALPVLRAVFAYCRRLAENHPSEALDSNLNAMARASPWLGSAEGGAELAGDRASLPIEFLHNLDFPLLDQIEERSRALKEPVKAVRTVSRFFDKNPSLLLQNPPPLVRCLDAVESECQSDQRSRSYPLDKSQAPVTFAK